MLVPLKAVVMNLLSIGAAYGVVVAVFQWGWGSDLLGIGDPGPIEVWVPTMLFAIVFGLSMDYEVFLLSRVRKEYDRTLDNSLAVSEGLAATARVITGCRRHGLCSPASCWATIGPSRCSAWASVTVDGSSVGAEGERAGEPERARAGVG